MKQQEFLPIFKMMCEAYNARLPFKETTLSVWFKILHDLPTDLVEAAALEFMSSPSAFPPTPGQVRGKAIDLQKRANKVPSAAEAWEMLMIAPPDGIRRWSEERADGWHIYNEPYQFAHPIVEKVARNLGWPGRFWTDNLVSDRSKFIWAYEQQMGISTIEATSLPEVTEYIDRIGAVDLRQLTASFRAAALERGE